MPRILLTGTYSSRNKGDAAMELTAASQLESCIDQCRVVVSSPFVDIDRPFYAPFQVIKSNRRRLIWATLQLLRARIAYMALFQGESGERCLLLDPG